jgi:uncharacterized YigZ family protein
MATQSEDTYYSIENAIEGILLKEKNSKFFSFAFPVVSESEVKEIITEIKKKHPNANHACYAYQIGYKSKQYRANDDGEPNNSAGMPIYGQIQSCNVTNVLVVVVRYFGGVKLGVGGLVAAYKAAAKMVLEETTKVICIERIQLKIKYEYQDHSNFMRIIKEVDATVISQKMEMNCEWIISIPEKQKAAFLEKCTVLKTSLIKNND